MSVEVVCPYCEYENTVPYAPPGKLNPYHHFKECENCKKRFVYRTGFIKELLA